MVQTPPRGTLPPSICDWCSLGLGEVLGYEEMELFAVDSVTRLKQGQCRDRWFLNAMALVFLSEAGLKKHLLRRSFASHVHKDLGIYSIRFWKDGKERVVHVDDRIPCYRGGTPLNCSCRSVLLEYGIVSCPTLLPCFLLRSSIMISFHCSFHSFLLSEQRSNELTPCRRLVILPVLNTAF